jgi:ATP-dependent Clp protease ATP-binding subunit ClpA
MLDSDLVVASIKTKADFEAKILLLLNESEMLAMLILVFSDFPSFLRSADALGIDLAALLDPYLISANLQIIGLD